jgi:hypothetical protein
MFNVIGPEVSWSHFEIRPQTLILKGSSTIGSFFEIRDFIHGLKGDLHFDAFPINDVDVAVRFETIGQCIALWRAVKIVPFRGHLLDVEAHARAINRQNERESQQSRVKSRFQRPVIQLESKKAAQLGIRIARRVNCPLNITRFSQMRT